MIRGQVSPDHEAVVVLTLRGPTGRQITVDAVIDTGFTEALTLEPQQVLALGLLFQDVSRMVLGDGSIASLSVYEAVVVWDSQERPVLVHAADGGCLMGMGLLYGHDLHVQVVDGGSVTIEPLP